MRLARVGQVQDALRVALHSVEKEIDLAKNGGQAVDSLEQLVYVAEKLKEMSGSLEEDPIRLIQVPGLWRIAIDNWPFESSLRHMVVEAELQYERLS